MRLLTPSVSSLPQHRRTSETSISPPGSSIGSPNRVICVRIAFQPPRGLCYPQVWLSKEFLRIAEDSCQVFIQLTSRVHLSCPRDSVLGPETQQGTGRALPAWSTEPGKHRVMGDKINFTWSTGKSKTEEPLVSSKTTTVGLLPHCLSELRVGQKSGVRVVCRVGTRGRYGCVIRR